MHFNTEGLGTGDSLSLCAEKLGAVIGPGRIDSFGADLTGTRGIFCSLEKLRVMTVFFTPQATVIQSSGVPGSDDVVMLRSMEGPLTVRQAGVEIVAEIGDFMFMPAAEPFEWLLPEGGRIDCGLLPSATLPVAREHLPRIFLRTIPKSFPPLQLLITYGAYLLMRGPHSDEEAEMMNAHFTEILPLVIGYLYDGKGGGNRPDRLASIKAHIDKNLPDQALSASAIAQIHGVTPRYVQLLFQQDGTTFSKYLLDRRLAAARSMIGRLGDERPISTIAYDVGFGDLSYFNRTFRRRYGASPTQLRRRPTA
ncbi:helix-turn-helix transcriptional regulator [Pararhizobium sp.]|uniref:helix-turn-helix transcriptional regulator n=1 Tax=Pararhizobium sp. TaxID=1977563 RepID=UPI002716F410|nr:AraC family transcriptional regulator [Pararhizobium sp.]MDO9417773.1 AraC family transcriptional regulator [Pararhizobium sp.]